MINVNEIIKKLNDEILMLNNYKKCIKEYEFHINKDGSGSSYYRIKGKKE